MRCHALLSWNKVHMLVQHLDMEDGKGAHHGHPRLMRESAAPGCRTSGCCSWTWTWTWTWIWKGAQHGCRCRRLTMRVVAPDCQPPVSHLPVSPKPWQGNDMTAGTQVEWSSRNGPDEVTDNLLQRCCEEGDVKKAVDAFLQLLEHQAYVPSVHTCRSLLQVCSKKKALAETKRVYAHMSNSRQGSQLLMVLGENVVDTFVKCGGLCDALRVFNSLSQSQQTVFSWTAILSGHATSGQAEKAVKLYDQMQEAGVEPNHYTFVSMLKVCGILGDLEKGRKIHAEAVRMGYGSDVFVGSTLIHMYASCGSIADAMQVFRSLPGQDVVSWTAMVAACTQHEQGEQAWQLFMEMQQEGVMPNKRTLVSVLKACGSLAGLEAAAETGSCSPQSEDEPAVAVNWKLASLRKGKLVHAEAVRMQCETDMFVANTLVDMYLKCGSIQDAWLVFNKMEHHDVVTWNAVMAGYVQQQEVDKVWHLQAEMQKKGVRPDERTFVTLLQACYSMAGTEQDSMVYGQCVKVGGLQRGKVLHAQVVSRGFESNIFVGNTLIHLYAKCGSIDDAWLVFEKLPRRNVVSWNTMFAGYAQQLQGHKALQLYTRMKEECKPSEATFVAILKACGSTGALHVCREIHESFLLPHHRSVKLANTLIHTYGKCGGMVEAEAMFHSVPQVKRTVVTWNALIAGYARLGDYINSLQCFERMQMQGPGSLKPNAVTFASLLCACSHAGMVGRGVELFSSMSTDYGLVPGTQHYVSLVDLLGRAGLLRQAEAVVARMPMACCQLPVLVSLLGGCRKHMDVELGRRAFEQAVALDAGHSAAYVLMSSIYSHAHMWEDAAHIDTMRVDAGAWKKAGESWVEHDNRVHSFAVLRQEKDQSSSSQSPQQKQNHKIVELVVRLTTLAAAMEHDARP